jgi:hypothetical protein
MSADLKTIQERQRKRYRLLKAIYELTDGGMTRGVHYTEAFQKAGLERNEGHNILRYLNEGGVLSKHAPIGWLALSSEGIKEVEESIKAGAGMDKECFIIMPFSDKENPADNRWDDLFNTCIKLAVEGAGLDYRCVRSFNPHGNFMSDIVEHLASAEVVIAVLTELRPNVMYELGVRHALKRKTIMLVEKGSEIPSDLNAFIALHYSTMTQKGREELTETIRERLALLDAGEPNSDNPVSDYLVRRAQSIIDDWQENKNPQSLLPRLAEILPSYAIKLGSILNKTSQHIESQRGQEATTATPPTETYGPIPLDRNSLSMYIGSSRRVKQLDKRMAEANDVLLEKWDTTMDALLDRLLEKAQYLGIKTVAELDENLNELGETALRLAYYFRVQQRMHAGYCLDRMFDVKAAQSGREGLINMYTSAKLESGGESWAEGVWQAYEQIKTYGIGVAGTT